VEIMPRNKDQGGGTRDGETLKNLGTERWMCNVCAVK
jgi:hypothetical protein